MGRISGANLKKKIFSELLPFLNFGHFNFANEISRKVLS